MSASHALRRYCFGPSQKSFSNRHNHRRRRIELEPLEERNLLTANIRSVDGTGNNVDDPTWGSTGVQLVREAPAAYADGVSAPAGADRLSAREISNLVVAQSGDILNNRDMSAFVYAWGQFLDHDIDQTTSGDLNESFPVQVPIGDPQFDPNKIGDQTIGLVRSEFDPATGLVLPDGTAVPRQQLNSITAFIDGSQIYGSDAVRAAALRTFQGGKLKTSDGDLLPFNTAGLPNDNPLGAPATSLFLAGDTRANENIELTAMQTLFVREHNRLADVLAAQHPHWNDEQIYQEARKLVGAELQVITYNEFIPALLGHSLPRYQGYDPTVNPGIANEFSTAAFRLGHSMLGTDVEFLDNSGNDTHDAVALRDAFFNPSMIEDTGIDPILKYLASDRAQEIDTHVVDDLRNFLFGQPGQGGMDLASLNIQRGRDHGLADYNSTRVAYGLPPVKTFADITSDPATQTALQQAYGSVDNIDLWVGALAENHLRGSSVGPLLNKILTDQFERLRDGDRFWYQNDLTGRDLIWAQSQTLAKVIARNTTTTNLQANVFFFHADIQGTVFFDLNANGHKDRAENGLGGILVQLEDADGNVVASTRTLRNGSYAFTGLDLGTYRVRLTLPDQLEQTTDDPLDVDLTRGSFMWGGNFGVSLKPHSGHPGR